jgi:TatD DNase family protein
VSATLRLIDTHSHLDDEKFRDDLPLVLERAAAAGLERVVTVATTAADSVRCVALAAQHTLLVASVGLQPNNLAESKPGDWDEVVRLVTSEKVVAVGETGLDRYWDFTPFPQQEEYFARHQELARKQQLPLIIHCREAQADMVRMLRDDFERNGPVRGVMHSFTGDADTARVCLDMGLFISFAGMVTYKNAQNLRDIARHIPADRLLIETDSPYLAPVPQRGKRNEPAFVIHTAECLARERGAQVVSLTEQTTRNARALFGLE